MSAAKQAKDPAPPPKRPWHHRIPVLGRVLRVKGAVLDKLPVFGALRRLVGWARRHKGIVYLILAIIIIFVVRPFLEIIAQLFKILQPLINGLLNNPVGRIVFYNVLALALLYWVWRKARAGISCALRDAAAPPRARPRRKTRDRKEPQK